MTTLFALFNEVERELISEPTREGLAKARGPGTKLGGPKGSLGTSRLDGREDEIRKLLDLGVSKKTPWPSSRVSPGQPCTTFSAPAA